MFWGKLAALLASAILLSGCAGQSNSTPTPTPTVSLEIKARTGNPDADRLIATLIASCELSKKQDFAVETPSLNSTIYSFAMPSKPLPLDDVLHQMAKKDGKYEVSGWPDGNPLCGEAMYADRVVPLGSPKNNDGIVFDYIIKKVSDNVFDWTIYRDSQYRRPYRITLEDNLVRSMKTDNGLVFNFSYDPLPASLEKIHQKILVEANMQYLALGEQMWDMTVPEAKAFCKKHGLTLLVGAEDGTYLFPSGPPGGKSDPKRMIVNTSDGKIVGVWTE